MIEDADLIRKFSEEFSHEAFAEIVQRHLPLVYAAALRQVAGDPALAQEVTQQVFTDLARKIRGLTRHPVLAGWLFTSTRYAARNAIRSEQRRRPREQEAFTMQDTLSQAIALGPRSAAEAESALARMPETARSQFASPEQFAASMIAKTLGAARSLEVVDQTAEGTDHASLHVRVVDESGTSERTFNFIWDADGWKWEFPEK